MEETKPTILEGQSDLEKGAYLGAIASIATADREATEEELAYLSELCDAASLSEQQKEMVLRAATELTGEELDKCLDVLKTSDLKHALITDLIAFARSDNDYNEAEEQHVHRIAQYLGVGEKQFSLLDKFATEAETASPEEVASPSFLANTGMQDKMQSAGINTGSLFKGLLGIAGPMILAGMLSRGMRGRGGGLMGGLGGLLGGGMMGGGGMLGGGGMGMGGGLGSLIGMLSGGRGMRSGGGLLGRILGGRRF